MVKSNCVFYALPRWLREVVRKQPPGEETYLIIRRSRIRWGFFHLLHGKLDPETNKIEVTSYKPPVGHKKTRFAPTFEGTVVHGDEVTKPADLT